MKMFDTHKTRVIGLLHGEETITICFHRIPEWTDRIAMSVSR